MDSLARMLSILDLYTETRGNLSADEIIEKLNCSKPTVYRYLKTLTNAGLLAPGTSGGFHLGARVIELDRTMRVSDALLIRAAPLLQELSRELDENLLLCGFYGEKLITIAQAWTHLEIATSYARGRPMPLLRGAAGKIILAHLPTHRLRSMMLRNPGEIAEAGLGETWPEFRNELQKIRKKGYSYSVGEIDDDIVGIAAPIFNGQVQVVGSLVLAIPQDRMISGREQPLAERMICVARNLSKSLKQTETVGGGTETQGKVTPAQKLLASAPDQQRPKSAAGAKSATRGSKSVNTPVQGARNARATSAGRKKPVSGL